MTQLIGNPVRRLVLGLAVLVAGASVGLPARAGTIIPMHEQTVSQAVSGSVRSVTVTGDYSRVNVVTGTATKVTAQEAWNFQQPKLTVTLTRGALKIDISCNDSTNVGGVVIVGSGDLTNDCTDDLTVTMPAHASLVASSSGAISSSGLHAAQRLRSYSASVTVTRAVGPVDASSGSGDVTASQIRGPVIRLASDAGAVQATDLRGTQVSLHSGQGLVGTTRVTATEVSLSSDAGDITVAGMTTHTLTLHSGQGGLAVTDATARSMVLTTDSGGITLSRAHTRSLVASSGQGTIKAEHLNASTATLHSDSGDLTLNDATTPTLELTSGQGVIATRDLHVTDLTATTDSGNITVETANAPTDLLLRSGQGTVLTDVATGTYAVTATSGQGAVTITGLTVNSAAPRHIDAHSDSGDVTVEGH